MGADILERKLDAATERLVRREKYASAVIVAARIARDLEQPLANLEWRIAKLEELAEREPEVRRIVIGLRRDRQAIKDAVRSLRSIEPPTGVAA
ncbi:MAG: hypothetical protein GTN89_09925 [Acidobacteria bacterium]|nr:hypothetical protein [Acidobacteriota bacterium]NIQ30672.1 hypothetical protein [Acidobacteriota bacterium]NIQ85630.1 hypothetical protein [Acidobacteriota bacterium]